MEDVFTRVFIFGTVLMVPIVLIVVPILVIRSMRTKPEKKFRKIYEGIDVSKNPGEGLVELRYHTYDGILLWFVQTDYTVAAGAYYQDDGRTTAPPRYEVNAITGDGQRAMAITDRYLERRLIC